MGFDYALFVFAQHSAAGGWNDLIGVFETPAEAMARGELECGSSYDHEAHIVRLSERRTVIRGERKYIPSTIAGQAATGFFSWTDAVERL